MKYKVMSKSFDKTEDCVVFESDKLKKCKKFAKENYLPEGNILKENGRIAIGDWYGAEDDDLGWEYD